MTSQTYNMMAKEAEEYYKWLIQDQNHLKDNCKRKPPYDWSDINERSKDEAMEHIAKSGNPHTSYYWNLAGPTDDGCPNWIARWFLYHKFRYRDGRNRNLPSKGDSGRGSYQHSSRHKHSASAGSSSTGSQYYGTQAYGSMTSGSHHQQYHSTGGPSSSGYAYDYGTNGSNTANYTPSEQNYEQDDGQRANSYYDPVRDVER